MTNTEPDRYPPGHQPYDKLVGMRIGAIVGGIVGIVLLAVLDGSFPWLILPFTVAGGVAGYLWQAADERRQAS